MKAIYSIVLLCLLAVSCNSEPTLQKYFVDNTENKDFIALDVSSTILNLDKAKLSMEQNEALKSFDKMNILAYKTDSTHIEKYDLEIKEVKLPIV